MHIEIPILFSVFTLLLTYTEISDTQIIEWKWQ